MRKRSCELFRARGQRLSPLSAQPPTSCAQEDERRHCELCRQPQHQLHEHLLYRCQFCAFAKGKTSENLRGKPYDLPLEEIQRRTREAWERGATEVCMQGGIHPAYTGATYLDICRGREGGCSRNARPCIFAARSVAGRAHAGRFARGIFDRAEARRPRNAAGNGRGDSRR